MAETIGLTVKEFNELNAMFDKPIFILINNKISWATNHDEGMSRLKAKKEELGK